MASGNLRCRVISCRLLYHHRYPPEEQVKPPEPLSEWYTVIYRGTEGDPSTRSRSNFVTLASLCNTVSARDFIKA